MSAFIVDNQHITALLDAAIAWGKPHMHYGQVRYIFPPVTNEPGAFQEGSPWGDSSVAIMRERMVEVGEENASEVGQMLLDENFRSANFRYAEGEAAHEYVWPRITSARLGFPKPLAILSALSCYTYQACESPEWATSEAHAFCEALQARAIHMLTSDTKVWEVTDPRQVR